MVGFLDEGLLVKNDLKNENPLEVSVVGFLDEGLLVFWPFPHNELPSFSGWIFR